MVGFYDSGVGGLTILQEVLKLQPNFSYIYLADTKALPLGDKTVEFIRNCVKEACIKLFNLGCDVVVLACNTASVTSIRYIQQVWLKENYPDKQVLSITSPLLELAEEELGPSINKLGLLFSTLATHNSGFYQYELIKKGFVNCKSVPLSGLADAIEKRDSDQVRKLILNQINIQKINQDLIEYIVLACTHYKWAIEEIQIIFSKAKIIEPSVVVAIKLLDYLNRHQEYVINKKCKTGFIITGSDKNFMRFAKNIGIENVDIRGY